MKHLIEFHKEKCNPFDNLQIKIMNAFTEFKNFDEIAQLGKSINESALNIQKTIEIGQAIKK